MYKDDWKSSWYHWWATYGHYHVISAKRNSTISCKLSYFWHPLRIGNSMLWCKERQLFLSGWFIIILMRMMMIGKASDSNYQSLMVHKHVISAKKHLLNFMQNEDIWHPLSLVNRMLYFRERHSLLLECFIAYHWCVRMIDRAHGIIDEPLVVIIMSFLPKDTLKFHAKYQTFGTLSESKIICCDVSRDNHCCLGVS